MSKCVYFIGCPHFGHEAMYRFVRANGDKVRPYSCAEEGDAVGLGTDRFERPEAVLILRRLRRMVQERTGLADAVDVERRARPQSEVLAQLAAVERVGRVGAKQAGDRRFPAG